MGRDVGLQGDGAVIVGENLMMALTAVEDAKLAFVGQRQLSCCWTWMC